MSSIYTLIRDYNIIYICAHPVVAGGGKNESVRRNGKNPCHPPHISVSLNTRPGRCLASSSPGFGVVVGHTKSNLRFLRTFAQLHTHLRAEVPPLPGMCRLPVFAPCTGTFPYLRVPRQSPAACCPSDPTSVAAVRPVNECDG